MILTCFIFLLTACKNSTYYHSFQPVHNTGWEKCDTLIYNLPSPIPIGSYEIQIGVRHFASYKYKDLWIEISHNLTDNHSLNIDTLNITLADEKGDWLGHGIGGVIQYTNKEKHVLSITDSIEQPAFKIIHLMDEVPLKGVYDMGIQLNRVP